MKKFLALVFLALLFAREVSVASTPIVNGCLIDAAEKQHELLIARQRLQRFTWVELLRIHFDDSGNGHALCVYALPGTGSVYAYDRAHGSFPLGTRSHDPRKLRELIAAYLGRPCSGGSFFK